MRTNDATYTELLSLRDKLELQHGKLQQELASVQRKLDSVSTTLEMLDSGSEDHQQDDIDDIDESEPTPDLTAESSKRLDIAGLRGLTQLSALKKIAEHNDGVLVTTTAKKYMLQAGLISNPANANNIMFSVIQRSGIFHRVGRGVYQLGAAKPERPTLVF